uniref:CRAL-TRIO domain-containing protein n=1 Tax=Heliothis virescens TaxID=7102 RepID=A0A2A4J6B5_HELVI
MEITSSNQLLKLPDGAVDYIRKLHNLDKPGRLEEAIKILEDWIQKQDHIIKKDFGKIYLEKTLISCKGSVEKSKKQIDRLCTLKTLVPKFFNKYHVKTELQHLLNLASFTPLPTVTKDYYRVICIKINNKDLLAESFMQYYQYNIILTEYIKAHDYVNGFIIVSDYRQVNMFDLVSKMNTVDLQQFVTILIEGYGARLKGIHLLTDSKAVDLFVKIMKQFLSEKIGNRVHVQPTLESLHEMVPKEILPVEYGGEERSIDKLNEEWVEELSTEKHVEYLKIMSKAGTDETKRLAGKFNEECMGMPGSFRNLSVD